MVVDSDKIQTTDAEIYRFKRINRLFQDIAQLRSTIAVRLDERDPTNENILSFTLTIDQIEKEINEIKEERFPLITNDLADSIEHGMNFLRLSSPVRTIVCSHALGSALASNNQRLLMDERVYLNVFDQDLILLKQFRWKNGLIRQICWSSTLERFILTTNKSKVYLVSENLTSIECLQTLDEQDWSSCTCSERTLFLTTNERGSKIVQVNLLSQFEQIEQWKSPQSCQKHEMIHNIVYNNDRIAVIIEDCFSQMIHIELRSSENLYRIWSFQSDIRCHPFQSAIRCCALNDNQWLVTDSSSLLHIDADGKMKDSYVYKSSPWNVILFRSNLIGVRTEYSFNFHRVC